MKKGSNKWRGYVQGMRRGKTVKKTHKGIKLLPGSAIHWPGCFLVLDLKIKVMVFLEKNLPFFISGIANTYQPVGCSFDIIESIDTLTALKKVRLLVNELILPSDCLMRTYTASHAGLYLMCVSLNACSFSFTHRSPSHILLTSYWVSHFHYYLSFITFNLFIILPFDCLLRT